MTSQGSAHGRLTRAIERRNLWVDGRKVRKERLLWFDRLRGRSQVFDG